MMHLMDLHARERRLAVQRALDGFMATHHGLIDRATAVDLGATKHLIAERVGSGAWEVLHRCVYRVAAAPRTREQELLAAQLACGPNSVASHLSAAWLWNLLAVPPDLPEIVLPHGHRAHHRGIVVRRSTDLVGSGISLRRGIAVTRPARTILDASAVAPHHVTTAIIDRAIAAKLVSVSGLLAVLDQYGRRGRGGSGKLRSVLEERGVAAPGRAPTVLESAMARLIKGLPVAPPIPEYVVANGKYRFDQAWPEIRFAAEPGGWSAHSSYDDWVRNIEKLNWAGENGWEVAQFTWDDVINHPDATATQLLRRIRARSLAAA